MWVKFLCGFEKINTQTLVFIMCSGTFQCRHFLRSVGSVLITLFRGQLYRDDCISVSGFQWISETSQWQRYEGPPLFGVTNNIMVTL